MNLENFAFDKVGRGVVKESGKWPRVTSKVFLDLSKLGLPNVGEQSRSEFKAILLIQ